MPVIVPPDRNQLGDAIVELEKLGGKPKQDFALSFNRWGETVLDVSDELYAKWESKSSSKSAKAESSDDESGPDKAGTKQPVKRGGK